MSELKMFCITIYENHFEKINKLNYLPVGLGEQISSPEFLRDNSGLNISKKIQIMESILSTIGYGKMVIKI